MRQWVLATAALIAAVAWGAGTAQAGPTEFVMPVISFTRLADRLWIRSQVPLPGVVLSKTLPVTSRIERPALVECRAAWKDSGLR